MRTVVVGDIHGDLAALDWLLERLPSLSSEDTLLFLGDYVDRGPDARGVIERVRSLQENGPAKVVALRGNHEDKWIESYKDPDFGFLVPRVNGCINTFRSFLREGPIGERSEVLRGGCAAEDARLIDDGESLTSRELEHLLRVSSWLPKDVIDWMESLPLWYEDEHAVYVHAGLEGKKGRWKHPRESDANILLWQRKYEFYTGYRGKRLVFGHTAVDELPVDHLGPYARYLGGNLEVWMRGDLIGLDTACGKGGHLSAIELPTSRIFDSRDTMLPIVGDETPIIPLLVAAR